MNLHMHMNSMGEASTSYAQCSMRKLGPRRPTHHAMHNRRLCRSYAFADNSHISQFEQPICSLKKERKKLAKSLKSHRKRVDKLLKSAAASTSQTALQEVFVELKRIQELLDKKDTQFSQLVASENSSSDSSDSEDERKMPMPAGVGRMVVAAFTVEAPEIMDVDELFEPVTYETPGRIVVCQGSKCQAKGGADVLRAVSSLASKNPGIDIIPCKCFGKCGEAPAMRVKAEGAAPQLQGRVELQSLPDILAQHFRESEPCS